MFSAQNLVLQMAVGQLTDSVTQQESSTALDKQLADERNRIELKAVQERFNAIKAAWPYDETQDMTAAQLKEMGAIDVTDSVGHLGIAQFKGGA